MAKVSVIVPCYNAERFLSSTIDSVLKQELSDWELILIDDGSTDTTWKIISHYAMAERRIAGFHKTNQGTTWSRNYGFEKADPSSTYIFFLDHDDQLTPSALSTMCAYMDTHHDVGLLACQFYDVTAEGQRLDSGYRSRWVPGSIIPRELRSYEIDTPFVCFFCATGQGPFALYRRSVFEQTEGWETDFWPHEDTDMFCQMALISKVHFIPERLYLKRTHPAQGMNNGSNVQKSYGAFREKWDNRQAKNEQEKIILNKAKKYYYTVHRPFRDLKVAKLAFSDFVSKPRRGTINWIVYLLESAFRGFFLARFKKY